MGKDIKEIMKFLRDGEIGQIAAHDVKLEDEVLKKYIKENAESLNWPQEPMCKLDPWQRMCYYQISGSMGTDCDVALFTVVVYYLAYGLGEKGWKINIYDKSHSKYQLKAPNEEVEWTLRGDTMNSYATPIIGGTGWAKGLLRRYFLTAYNDQMETDGILSDGCFVKKYQDFGKKRGDKLVWSAYMLDKWTDFISLLEDVLVKNKISKVAVDKYVRLNHTIGNFIPVPFVEGGGEFNSPRGFDGSSYEFWDLALMCIYNYYFSIHDSTCNLKYPHYDLKWLLSNDQNVNLCKNWLDSFDAEGDQTKWDAFVEQNFMQDLVNSEQGHYGMPKELWEGHFAGAVMPKGEQYNAFFENASERIEARGKKIAEKITKELKDKDLTALAKKMVCG